MHHFATASSSFPRSLRPRDCLLLPTLLRSYEATRHHPCYYDLRLDQLVELQLHDSLAQATDGLTRSHLDRGFHED